MKKLLLFLAMPILGFAQWTENFDAASSLPAGWAIINQGDANGWTIGSPPASASAQSGNNVAQISYDTAAHDDYLITKAIPVVQGQSNRISFYVKSLSATFMENYRVLLSTTDQNKDSFTQVLQETQKAPAEWKKLIFDLSAYNGQTVYVAVQATDADQWELLADTFVVDALPLCSAPVDMSVINVTNVSATLNFTVPATAPANGYEYVYSTTNTVPTGAGTPLTTTTVNLTALTPNTQYYVWVRSICSGVNSDWESTTFTTLPTPPVNDNCGTPVTLTVGAGVNDNPVVGTFVGATNSTDTTATHTCQNYAYKDVWYTVTVPASGNVTIETQANDNSQVEDTILTVYTGSCGALTQLVCNDDIDGQNQIYFSKAVVNGQAPGTVLLVAVRNYSSLVSDSFKVSAYDSALGTSEATAKNRISVYPNPFTDVIHLSNAREVKSVKVMDASGRLVSKFDNVSSELNLSKLSQGVYMIQVEGKDGSVNTIKAIKK